MKIGLSTYSLAGAFRSGILDFPSIITKIAEFGGENVEIVPLGSDFTVDTEMVDKVLKAAKDAPCWEGWRAYSSICSAQKQTMIWRHWHRR